MNRRNFLGLFAWKIGVVASGVLASGSLHAVRAVGFVRFLRPPGSVSEKDFAKKCIACGQCAQVCPNRCIKFFGITAGASANTPYIVPRDKACILCMRCGDVCPTGAIKKIKQEFTEILKNVKMGKAQVDTTLCLSYQGKTCGVCYRACKLADVAIKVQRLEQPIVLDACVGCGLCERMCIQVPQAIKIVPRYDLNSV